MKQPQTDDELNNQLNTLITRALTTAAQCATDDLAAFARSLDNPRYRRAAEIITRAMMPTIHQAQVIRHIGEAANKLRAEIDHAKHRHNKTP